MEIDWIVVAFEALNFGVLVVLLQRFLFRPIRRTLDHRREQIEKTQREVEAREAAATSEREAYQTRRRELESQAGVQVEEALAEGRARAEQLVAEGREHARELIAAAEQQIASARRHALEHLRTEVISLATDAATRVIQHMDAPPVTLAYARRAAHGFAELFSDGIPDTIEVDVGEDADVDAIQAELHEILGPTCQFEIAIDPLLVAGARLRAKGHEVDASATASLARWYAQQVGEGPAAEAAQ